MRTFLFRGYIREMNGSQPDLVARAVNDALTSRRPKTRYVIGKHAKLLANVPRILPDPVLDALLLSIAGMPTKMGAAVSDKQQTFRKRAA